MLTPRRAFTLVEILVSLAVTAVMLAMFATIGLREHRMFADLADRDALDERLGDVSAILPLDLRAIAASEGDVKEARDTAIEIRETIASGIVCDTASGALILPAASSGPTPLAAYSTQPDVGDSLWMLAPSDTSDAWLAYRITAAATVRGGSCAPMGPRSPDTLAANTRLRITAWPSPIAPIGLPVRITRPLRYSLYRASDGAWYLGARDWSSSSARLNIIQPVAGPFLSATQGGLGLRYLDSTGATIASPVADTRSIASIQISARGQTRSAVRVLGAATTGVRTDSVLASVGLRNRP